MWLKHGNLANPHWEGAEIAMMIFTRHQVSRVRKAGYYISACMGRVSDDPTTTLQRFDDKLLFS